MPASCSFEVCLRSEGRFYCQKFQQGKATWEIYEKDGKQMLLIDWVKYGILTPLPSTFRFSGMHDARLPHEKLIALRDSFRGKYELEVVDAAAKIWSGSALGEWRAVIFSS